MNTLGNISLGPSHHAMKKTDRQTDERKKERKSSSDLCFVVIDEWLRMEEESYESKIIWALSTDIPIIT